MQHTVPHARLVVGFAGGAKQQSPAVSVHADAAEGRKKARGVQPGSFLNLMINSKHSNGEPFSDLLASSQAFTFLLVRKLPSGGLMWRCLAFTCKFDWPCVLCRSVLGYMYVGVKILELSAEQKRSLL